MAVEVEEIIISEGPDGKLILSNLNDQFTGESAIFKEVSTYTDGTLMDDSKVIGDGKIYIKKFGKYFKRKTTFVNVKEFGARGDGVTDDSYAILEAIEFIKKQRKIFYERKNFNFQDVLMVLYFPSGNYLSSQKIVIPSGITVDGDNMNTTVLFTKNRTINLIEIADTDNVAGSANLEAFTTFKDISINGYHADRNPFEYKDSATATNVGVLITKSKVKLENVLVSGFEGSGIETRGVYYIYITNSYIFNNRYGLNINSTSTSVFALNTEIRTNSIGIYGSSSYSCYFTNCLIESNIANFLPQPNLSTTAAYASRGAGATLRQCRNFVFDNCYIENHAFSFVLYGSTHNKVENCILVPATYYDGIDGRQRANVVVFATENAVVARGNKFVDNLYLGPGTRFNINGTDDPSNLFIFNTIEDFNAAVTANPGILSTFSLPSSFLYKTNNKPVQRSYQPPIFTSSTRPSTPRVYDFIYNSETKEFEYWDGATWKGYGKEALRRGTNVNKPISYISIGSDYYNETLGLFQKWNGSEWVDQLPRASQTEVNTGSTDNKAVTPLTLETKLKQGVVSAITTANATDEATAIALTNEIKAKVNEMVTKLSTIIFK